MSDSFHQANDALNAMLDAGKPMDAFEKFYSQHVQMQENAGEPRIGKEANRQACAEFYQSYPDLRLKVLRTAYGDKLSMQEVEFRYTEDGQAIQYVEVAIRHWEDMMVVKERFVYDTGGDTA